MLRIPFDNKDVPVINFNKVYNLFEYKILVLEKKLEYYSDKPEYETIKKELNIVSKKYKKYKHNNIIPNIGIGLVRFVTISDINKSYFIFPFYNNLIECRLLYKKFKNNTCHISLSFIDNDHNLMTKSKEINMNKFMNQTEANDIILPYYYKFEDEFFDIPKTINNKWIIDNNFELK